MKNFFARIGKFLLSLITDIQWDGDPAKVFGLAMIICGVVGFFLKMPDFQWVIGFGAGLIGSGKFSAQG